MGRDKVIVAFANQDLMELKRALMGMLLLSKSEGVVIIELPDGCRSHLQLSAQTLMSVVTSQNQPRAAYGLCFLFSGSNCFTFKISPCRRPPRSQDVASLYSINGQVEPWLLHVKTSLIGLAALGSGAFRIHKSS